MGNAILENKRVRVAITDALFTLMRDKPLSQISISAIVRQANVARASFYRNFEVKEAIVETYLDEIFLRITDADTRILSGQPVNREIIYRVVLNAMDTFQQDRERILLLCRDGFMTTMQKVADIHVEQIAGDMVYHSADKYLLYCISGASVNMLIHWLVNSAAEPKEHIARVCADFLLMGYNKISKK